MTDVTDRRAALLDAKLKTLIAKRAALDVEHASASEKLHHLRFRHHIGVSINYLADILQHRINRLPVIMEHIDGEIRQAERDIDNHRRWNLKP